MTMKAALVVHLLRLLLLLPLLPAAAVVHAQTSETVGPMTVVLPAGWTRRPTDPVSFYVAEVTAAGQEEAHVFLNSVVQPGAAAAAVHAAVWNQMLQRETRPKRQSNGSFGRFAWSQMEVQAGGQRSEFNRLYTTQADTTHLVVLFVTNSANMLNKHLPTVERVLANAKIRGAPESAQAAPPAGSTTAPQRPAGLPWLPATDVPITEAHVHVETRGVSLTSNVLTDHILFFQNGVVVREGVITAPRTCYATIPADVNPLPFNYGRWRENKAAGEVTIQWQEGPAWSLKREGERLSLGGKRLLKYRPLDGMKLDGTFVHRSLVGTNIPLVLRRDGTFETSGLMEEMICQPPDRSPTLAGSGSYEVRKWTLILRFNSGKVTLLPISILSDEDPQAVNKFSLRSSYDFVRVR